MGACSSKNDDTDAASTRFTDNSSRFADETSGKRSRRVQAAGSCPPKALCPPADIIQPPAATLELPSPNLSNITASQQRYLSALEASVTPENRSELLSLLGYSPEESSAIMRVRANDVTRVGRLFFAKLAQPSVSELDVVFLQAMGLSAEQAGVEVDKAETSAFDEGLNADGMEALRACLDLQSDEHVLYLLHALGCVDGPWAVSHATWTSGCMRLRICSASDLKATAAKLATRYDSLTISDKEFTRFYNFLWTFMKSPSARSVPLDVALTVWETVLPSKWNGGAAWCAHVQAAPVKPIFRDLWIQLGTFAATVAWPNCREADIDSSWPTLIDTFVDVSRHPPKEAKPTDE